VAVVKNKISKTSYLSKREQQIMDAVYRLGRATANEILSNIPDPPTGDAVRRLIRILEEKGYLRHGKQGPRHVYRPTIPPEKARVRALNHLIRIHFRGSASQTMAALLDSRAGKLSERDLDEISLLIEKKRREGR
jgi:predicted transcriptional regulator